MISPTHREADAIRTGVQYAYSDILMEAIPVKRIRVAISMVLILIIPLTNHWMTDSKHLNTGPIHAILSAFTLAGVSFIIDCIMPLSMDSLSQDIIQVIPR